MNPSNNMDHTEKLELTQDRTGIEQAAREIAKDLAKKFGGFEFPNSLLRQLEIVVEGHLTSLTKPLEDENRRLKAINDRFMAEHVELKDENKRLREALEGLLRYEFDILNVGGYSSVEEAKALTKPT